MALNFAAKGLQSSLFLAPYSFSASKTPSSSRISSLLSNRNCCNRNCRAVYRSTLFGSYRSRGHDLKKLACNSSFDDKFSDDEFYSIRREDLARRFDEEHDIDKEKEFPSSVSELSADGLRIEAENGWQMASSMPSKLELLEPSLLGIKPEPPDWPERDDIVSMSIAMKAKSLDIPLSLRLITRKQKWQQGLVDAEEFNRCSVKKALSWLTFMVRELRSHALHIQEDLYNENLEEVIGIVQREMNASFVCLFQQVFSRTPSLMVHMVILLANFMVNSMAHHVTLAANTSSPGALSNGNTIMESTLLATEETKQETPKFLGSSALKDSSVLPSSVSKNDGGVSRKFPVPDELPENSSSGDNESIKEKVEDEEDDDEEEVALWTSMVDEALRMLDESEFTVLDHNIKQQLVSQVNVELEKDDYGDYFRTDLSYQMRIAEEPNDALLLSNYAQFLSMVAHDHDRAELCFKRAIEVEPPDPEALSRYADFLWRVRKDVWGAEERYLQSIEAAPKNPYYGSKYTAFLWCTGGKDTCFPISSNHYDNYNEVFFDR